MSDGTQSKGVLGRSAWPGSGFFLDPRLSALAPGVAGGLNGRRPSMRDDSRNTDADEVSYRELVQSANTIVLRWDLEGRVTFLNEFGLEFFGYTSDELIGRSVVGSIVPETET